MTEAATAAIKLRAPKARTNPVKASPIPAMHSPDQNPYSGTARPVAWNSSRPSKATIGTLSVNRTLDPFGPSPAT